VAVANATAGAKEAADLVLTHTNEESAIAELIERLERELPF
jgi:hydroxymethylpyrimidine pyrophosphatase-like HAD family hydrolase